MSAPYKTIMSIPKMEEVIEKYKTNSSFRIYDNFGVADSYKYLGAKMVHNEDEYYFANRNLAIFFFTIHGDIQQDERNEITERFTAGYKKGYAETETTILEKLGLQERSHNNIQAIVCKMYVELYKKYDGWLYSSIDKFHNVGYNQGQLHRLKVMMQGLDTVNARERPKIPQLHLGLSEKQITVLYDQLVTHEFINKETDRVSFNWALGGSNQPQYFAAIEWTARSKHSLRELLKLFGVTISNQMIRDIGILFSYKNKQLILNKDQNDNSANIKEIESIVESVKTAR